MGKRDLGFNLAFAALGLVCLAALAVAVHRAGLRLSLDYNEG